MKTSNETAVFPASPRIRYSAAAASSVAFLFILIHIYFGVSFIRSSAATYDEPVHLASGYSYWMTGRYRLNIMDHPPLAEMWDAVPLIWMRPNLYLQLPDWIDNRLYHYSDYFLYHNRVDPDRMLNAARFFSLLSWTALIGFAVLAWARRLAGEIGMIGAAAAYAFCPAFISNNSLVTTDAAATAFFFLTFWALSRPGSRSLSRWAAGGLCMGLAHASKFNMILIGPLVLGLAAAEWRMQSVPRPKFPIGGLCVFLGAGLLTLAAVYRFSQFSLYYQGLSATLHRLDEGRSSFFWGKHSTTGFLFYFPAALVVKMPISILILAAVGVVSMVRPVFPSPCPLPQGARGNFAIPLFFGNRNKVRVELLWLVVPPLAYLAAAMSAKVQIGYRHVLPMIPFLIIWAGCGWAWLWSFNSWGKWAAGALGAWLIVSVWRVQPCDLAYFNESVGGPAKGYEYLVDSNLDWGQGLKDLAVRLKGMGNPPIYLSYFGSADPAAYDIHYVPVGFVTNADRKGESIDPSASGKILLAVSATNLQGTYYANKSIFEWLKSRTPISVVGYSFFLYDLTGDPEGRKTLAGLLESSGQPSAARALLQKPHG